MEETNSGIVEKTFTQSDVDRIVGERLAREGIHDMKEIVETLKDFDYTGTPAEVKAALKAQAEVMKQQKAEEQKQAEIEALREQARSDGTSPELLAEIKSLKAEMDAIKKKEIEASKAIEAQKKAAEMWTKQESEFKEKYPNVDLSKLDGDEKFLKFVKRSNPTLTLVEKYEDYVELVGGAESAAMEKFKLNADRSTSSGKSKGESSGGTYGLTARQQSLAEDNGMTYKEYSDFLKMIKK